MPIVRVPDALFLPASMKHGERASARVVSICDPAETILGGRAWIRQQPGGRLFVTRDPADTLLFAKGHERAGQPRYRWEPRPDGSRWGYLVEGADDVG